MTLTKIKREEEREMCHISFGRNVSPNSFFFKTGPQPCFLKVFRAGSSLGFTVCYVSSWAYDQLFMEGCHILTYLILPSR